jgi:probable HAF family extracellular repeat protein
VVGTADIAGGAAHAFLYDTQMRDLNDMIAPGSGWELVRAFAINDAGQITGHGIFQGQERAFLLTPVPEPSAALAGATAAAAAACVARRRVGRTVCPSCRLRPPGLFRNPPRAC